MVQTVRRVVPWLLIPLLAPAAVAAAGTARLERRVAHTHPSHPSHLVPAGTRREASIKGRITEKEGGLPIPSVQVTVEGTRQGSVTNNNGEYVISGLAAGAVRLRASRIGYQQATSAVTVPSEGSVTADFTLERAVAKLEEVITTATGEQSRREFGNVVATVKADSIAPIAPVTTVQDMMTARTPGLEIFNGIGVSGANEPIRIRGLSSLSLTNDPLMIVDGVRYDNGTVPGSFATSTSRVADLSPEDIESIDIIKGPSAAALYGTAAGAGVIIVKTKRGSASSTAHWSVFGEEGGVTQPSAFENNWRSWGHNLNSAGQPVGNPTQCYTFKAALKQCEIDSLTTNNPYTNPLTSPFRDADGNLRQTPRSSFGLQASGGSDLLRYFVSGVHQGETGPFVMPDSEVKRITVSRGTAPTNTQVHPNQYRQDNYRGNFQLALSPNATIDVSAGFSDRTLWEPFDGGFFAGLTFQLMTAPGARSIARRRSAPTATGRTARSASTWATSFRWSSARATSGSPAARRSTGRPSAGCRSGRRSAWTSRTPTSSVTSCSAKARTRPRPGARTRRRDSPAWISSGTITTNTRSTSASPARAS